LLGEFHVPFTALINLRVEKKTAKSPEFAPSKTTASVLPGEITAI
jgi:hypothetical protein